jgi:hypothetical protein
MHNYMAADLAALFTYEFTSTCTLGTATQGYTVIVGDDQQTEQDAFGGPESEDKQAVHFKVSSLPAITNGSVLVLNTPSGNQRKIVVSNTTSADGVELIAYVRAA